MAAASGSSTEASASKSAEEAVQSLPQGIDDFVFALKDRFGFPAAETEVLEYWQNTDAFKQQLELTKDCPEFTFYDGPPFATGTPHYGHILAGTIKDVVTRYATLKGRYVKRRAGWDTHGLPIEFEIDKQYDIKSKADVMALPGGIAEYNRRCRAIVMRYTAEWESTVGRLGRWIDFRDDYKTMDPTFMESVWWVFKRLFDKGLVYRGFKVMPYSTGCTTPLSNFESGLNYKDDIADPAVVAAFPMTGTRHESATGPMPEFPGGGPKGVELVAWTTTPWTLPSNLGLCVHPEMEYVLIRDIKTGTRRILMKARLEQLYHGLKKAKKYKGGEFEELASYSGKQLAGLQYEPLFDYFVKDPRVAGQGWRVLVDEYVTDDSGTGVVHQAPAFGEDDFRVCLGHGVIKKDGGVPCPLDDKGAFSNEVPDFEGMYIKDADREIIKNVKARGRLVQNESIKHRYPYCWRSDTPLIYRTVPSWFVRVESIKHIQREAGDAHIRPADLDIADAVRAAHAGESFDPRAAAAAGGSGGGASSQPAASGAGADTISEDDVGLLANNARTHWVPEHIRDGRFHNWLKQARDWAVSRNRYWGTPLPIWSSEDGKEIVCVGSIDELEKLSGVRVTDLHRDTVDKITIPSREGNGDLKRVEEVFDCWFESGSMPYAQVHHPFEGEEEEQKFLRDRFPADFIAEGIDQTRGWFYTLMVLSTALYHRPAFKNVVVNGLVMAEDGKKMSKRLKNYPAPELVLDEFGADALRLYLISSPAVRGDEVNFSKAGVHGVIRDVMLPWYNAFRFFALGVAQYEENKDEGVPSFGPDLEVAKSSRNILDRWIMATMQSLLRFVRSEMEEYKLNTVVPRLLQTVQQLTNWYIKLNRGRLHSKEGADEARKSLAVMYEVLALLSTLMAPFAPFFSEWSYLRLRALHPLQGQHADKPTEFGAALSVHHLRLPAFDQSLIDTQIEKRVIVMQRIIESARSVRERIKTSQRIPVQSVTIVHPSADLLEGVEELAEYIKQETNCFEMHQSQDVRSVCELSLKPDARRLGKRLGKEFGAVRAAISKANAEEVLAELDAGKTVSMADVPLSKEDFVFERVFKGDTTKYEAQITPVSFDGVGGSTGASSERVADLVVYVNKEQSDELWSMGVARDIASKLQQLRKKAKLFLTDNVRTLVRARPRTDAERAIVALQEALSHKPAAAAAPAPAPAKGKGKGKGKEQGAAKGGAAAKGAAAKGGAKKEAKAEKAQTDTEKAAAKPKSGQKQKTPKAEVDLESIPEDQLSKSQRKRLEKLRKKAGKRGDAKAKAAASGAGEEEKQSWMTSRSPAEGAQFVMDSIGTNAALVVKQLRQMAVPLCSATMPAAAGEIARDVVALEGDVVAELVLTRETCFAGDRQLLVEAAKAAGASSDEAAQNAASAVEALMPTVLRSDLCAMAPEEGSQFDLVVDAGDGKKKSEMLTLRLQRGKHAFASDAEMVRGSAGARAELEQAGFGRLAAALAEFKDL